MADHVELIARVIGGDVCDAGYWLTEAKRVLAALAAEGLVIVPLEPTPAMSTAGLDVAWKPGDANWFVRMNAGYRAMLAAAGGDDG